MVAFGAPLVFWIPVLFGIKAHVKAVQEDSFETLPVSKIQRHQAGIIAIEALKPTTNTFCPNLAVSQYQIGPAYLWANMLFK